MIDSECHWLRLMYECSISHQMEGELIAEPAEREVTLLRISKVVHVNAIVSN